MAGKKVLWFTQIFKDNNDYNEKTIIGFISFAMMVGTAVLDLVMSAKGTPIEIKEYIYTSFVTVTLGSFGVAGLERFSGAAKVEAEAAVKTEDLPSTKECPSCGTLLT
jgi:L-cystine uptake protein TcyP (sodium:dicarboxylate symporter family)